MFFLVSFAGSLKAQLNTGIVRYKVITGLTDTLNRKVTLSDMIFSSTASLYRKGRTSKQNPSDTTRIVSYDAEEKQEFVYKDTQLRQLISREFALTEHIIVQDTMTPITWTLKTDTRQIGSLVCRKAEAMVRGRYYTAWYAPDIPISSGPWKLYGLPGLILEATDAERRVLFLFESIEIPAPTESVLKTPKLGKGQKIMSLNAFARQLEMNKANVAHMSVKPGQENTTAKVNFWTVEIYPK